MKPFNIEIQNWKEIITDCIKVEKINQDINWLDLPEALWEELISRLGKLKITSKNWYVLELLKVDTIRSVLKISRFDMKKDIIIPYKKLIPLIDQDSQLTLIPLLNLIWIK